VSFSGVMPPTARASRFVESIVVSRWGEPVTVGPPAASVPLATISAGSTTTTHPSWSEQEADLPPIGDYALIGGVAAVVSYVLTFPLRRLAARYRSSPRRTSVACTLSSSPMVAGSPCSSRSWPR